ncbi:LysR family transcriptional regulator [Cytobacillus gottheilii]|uniref:LysR family transcriptional regulator n=1 Tax=Cytobacillus gottheilii TaxID=859144 RepID=UPI002494825C|nr:LysR family transcriptional regulator [Cytobacillus gottheilii]
MDIDQLKAFIFVANTKSFTRTAELLNVVQSTVTTRIQALEMQLGKELFERDKRNIKITDAGSIFLQYAERILDLNNEGVKAVQLNNCLSNHIIIGTTHVLWDYVLFEAIDTFQKTQLETSISMVTEHSNILIRKMIDGLIDLAIVFYPVNHTNINMELIIEDSFVLVADRHFKIPENFVISRDLRNHQYIHLNWGGSFTAWFKQVSENQDFYHLQVDHVSLLLKFLKTRNGLGFLPNTIAKRLIQQDEVINVPFQTDINVPKRSIYLLKRKKNNSTKRLDLLADNIKNIF